VSGRPDVSVAIVTYNARRVLGECLRSLPSALSRHSYEVIVADNGSADGTPVTVRSEWPFVRLMELGANRGFSFANNKVLNAARGRYVLLLNPDTMARPGSIDELVAFADEHADVGVVAPRLLNVDSTDQGTARAFPTPAAALFGRHSLLTRLFPNNRWSRDYLVGRQHVGDEPFEIDWVSGACMLVSRRAIDAAGSLDEGFFMYWEDADWCRRIKHAGHRVFCVPKAHVVHLDGSRARRLPAYQVWAFHSSAYRYYSKHHLRQSWNPLRALAAFVLYGRAALIIVRNQIAWPPRPSEAMGGK
jgi:N-acetylglucosaminyl-diphospho-decaprenol L-rhamnosyltransferase